MLTSQFAAKQHKVGNFACRMGGRTKITMQTTAATVMNTTSFLREISLGSVAICSVTARSISSREMSGADADANSSGGRCSQIHGEFSD
jgi:hypothetical protein